MKRLLATTLFLSAAVMLAGCHGKKAVIEPPTTGTQVPANSAQSGVNGSGTSMTPLGAEGAASQIAQQGNSAPLETRVIYFDFDSSEIKPEFDNVIATHARALSAHPDLKIKLEGNTDERGTREYNIGLGERRAQAVRRALMLQGVADTQVTTISYGAERPAVEGDNEAAWAKNRRVDMVYVP